MSPEKIAEIIMHLLTSDAFTVCNEALEKIKYNRALYHTALSYTMSCTSNGIPVCADFQRGILLTLLVLEEEKVSKEIAELEYLVKAEEPNV